MIASTCVDHQPTGQLPVGSINTDRVCKCIILNCREGRSFAWDLLRVDEFRQAGDGCEALFATRCVVFLIEHGCSTRLLCKVFNIRWLYPLCGLRLSTTIFPTGEVWLSSEAYRTHNAAAIKAPIRRSSHNYTCIHEMCGRGILQLGHLGWWLLSRDKLEYRGKDRPGVHTYSPAIIEVSHSYCTDTCTTQGQQLYCTRIFVYNIARCQSCIVLTLLDPFLSCNERQKGSLNNPGIVIESRYSQATCVHRQKYLDMSIKTHLYIMFFTRILYMDKTYLETLQYASCGSSTSIYLGTVSG